LNPKQVPRPGRTHVLDYTTFDFYYLEICEAGALVSSCDFPTLTRYQQG
jgi:hypothetical protein